MAKLKIDVHDLHKYYGENEKSFKGISTNSMKGDGFVSNHLVQVTNLPTQSQSSRRSNQGQITNGYGIFTDPKTNIIVRENVGMVFQHFNLFLIRSAIIENIMFAPLEHKTHESRRSLRN